MRLLVIGNGGREHAICRALKTGDKPVELWVAPGNPGTANCGENVAVGATDTAALVALAQEEKIDLVVPGPEASLVAGIADRCIAAGIPCCGPIAAAAALEGSKVFMRELTAAAGVPGARFTVVADKAALEGALEAWEGVPVIKADGLAAGKGVFLPESKAEALEIGAGLLQGSLGDAGRRVLLEERLVGTEASLFYACDGQRAVPLPHARDHKRLHDGEIGPNTGGMGAISPNPSIDATLEETVRRTIVDPTLQALRDQGHPFSGFLFAGLMLTDRGPRLLEFNVRLGDPEAQAILPRLRPGRFLDICHAAASGALDQVTVQSTADATCCVVLAAKGYPEQPQKGDRITIAEELYRSDRWLDHAGTRMDGANLLTSGGRVAAVVARAESVAAARASAYEGVRLVEFAGKHTRSDIGRETAANP